MKKLIYLLTCLLFTACNQPKQKDLSVEKIQSKKDIGVSNISLPNNVEDIKAMFTSTTQKLVQQKLDSVLLNYNCNQERSGRITYFTENGKLKLIIHQYAEYDHHEMIDQYFIQDNKLYFVFQKRLSWSFISANVAGATEDKITENRFYLIGNEAVRCLEKKYVTSSVSSKKIIPEQIPNETVACKSATPILNALNKLITFRTSKNADCFEK